MVDRNVVWLGSFCARSVFTQIYNDVSSLANMAASKQSVQHWSAAQSLFLNQTVKELNIIRPLR